MVSARCSAVECALIDSSAGSTPAGPLLEDSYCTSSNSSPINLSPCEANATESTPKPCCLNKENIKLLVRTRKTFLRTVIPVALAYSSLW